MPAIPAKYRTLVYVLAVLVAVGLVVAELVTGVDAVDLIARFGVLAGALLAVIYRPTRNPSNQSGGTLPFRTGGTVPFERVYDPDGFVIEHTDGGPLDGTR